MDLGVKVMKEYFILPISPEAQLPYQMQFRVIIRTTSFGGWKSSFSAGDTVSIF